MLPEPVFSYRKLVRTVKRYPVQTVIVLVLLALLGQLLPARAQDALGLTSPQLETVKRLGDEALTHSSAFIAAARELQGVQQEESVLGQTLKGVNVNIGAGVGANDPFEQVNTRANFSISLNLTAIAREASAPSRQPALQARLAETERGIRLEVVKRFSDWRIALAKASASADGLDVRQAEKKAVEARVKAGTATQTDLLKYVDLVNNASIDLLEKNHGIVLAKLELARVVGVSLERLNELLGR